MYITFFKFRMAGIQTQSGPSLAEKVHPKLAASAKLVIYFIFSLFLFFLKFSFSFIFKVIFSLLKLFFHF